MRARSRKLIVSISSECCTPILHENSLTSLSEHSANYDSKPWQQRIEQQVAAGLQERKDWIGIRWAKNDDMQFGRETKLLDYACGTGSITRALGPSVTTIRGIDISENMVQRYNEAAQSAGLESKRVNAIVGDLLAEEVPDHLKTPEYYDFDIAVIGLGFHHFENPVLAVERLAERLKPGTGVLLIVDFLPFDDEADGSSDPWKGTIKNRGFARANMEKLYSVAKLEKFSFSMLEEPVVMGSEDSTKKRSLFFAKGKKAATAWGKIANWVYDMQMAASEQTKSMTPGKDEPGQGQLGFFGERTKK